MHNYGNKKINEQFKEKYKEESEKEDKELVISFKNTCETKYLLSNWKEKDLSKLSDCLKRISNMKWNEFYRYSGFHIKIIHKESIIKLIPNEISPEETIYEMRIGNDSPRRLFFYRNKNVIYLIWFDLKHEICKV